LACGAKLARLTIALAIDNASVRLGGRLALDSVSLTVRAGEIVGLVGPNGGGKTTLLRAALGLTPLAGGEVKLGGRAVASLKESERARLAAYLPQGRDIAWNLQAWRLVSLGLPRLSGSAARDASIAALEGLGVAGLADRGVLDMSGGERARVLLARMIVTGSPLLLADEPAAGLDPDAQFLVMDLLRTQAARGAAIVVSLHDLTLAARGCDQVAVLTEGRMMTCDIPAVALSPKILRHAFGLEGELVSTPHGPVIAVARGYRPPELGGAGATTTEGPGARDGR
jgi:iron complex transport system ATP-binding protein